MKIEIEITEQEIKDLKAVRNYFGEHDKTCFEHMAFAVLDVFVKKLTSKLVCSIPNCKKEVYKIGCCKSHYRMLPTR